MKQQHGDAIRSAAQALYRGMPNKLLAEALGCPRGTARSWLSGHRRAPVHVLEALAAWLRAHASLSQALAVELEGKARARKTEQKVRRGFLEVKVRDASGIPRDARWRGGDGWF